MNLRDTFYDWKDMLSASNTKSRVFYWFVTLVYILVAIALVGLTVLTIIGYIHMPTLLWCWIGIIAAVILSVGSFIFLARQ